MKGVLVLKGLLFCGLILSSNSAFAFSWAPINPAELKMTEEPKAPGAPAIILEKQEDRDDMESKVSVYIRIKVLTEPGREYGSVEIPYQKGSESIHYIQARTIKPDGKIIEFDDKIFDKLIVKAQGVKYQAKTFTLPEVQVGSIIEYRYLRQLDSNYIFDSQWILSDELFTRHAKYSLIPNSYFSLTWSWPRGLPPGTQNPAEKRGIITLEVSDVGAFQAEGFMPPEEELKYRVNFVYNEPDLSRIASGKDPVKFWNAYSKLKSRPVEEFLDESKEMHRIVAPMMVGLSSDDDKLRKIYNHVQSLRNLDYEREKTESEQKRDKLKERKSIADVETYGYGNGTDLTYLFVGLARAAGFSADMAFIATRNRAFFQSGLLNPNGLSSNVAVVTVNGKDVFFEPGVPFMPFGLLPWYETGVAGLRINKTGGNWITTPITSSAQSKTMRKADFKLEDGSLNGTVVVTYTGLDALDRRLDEMLDDAAARKEYAENELKQAIPTGIDVTLSNEPDWTGVDTPLVLEFKVKVPGWASAAGKRLLMPIGLFGAGDKRIFEHETRIHPIYFHYKRTADDDIAIELPAGMKVDSLPKPRDENIQVTTFSSSVDQVGNELHIHRNKTINGIVISEKYYLALRDFFQIVRSNDEEQIVLSLVPVTSSQTKPLSKH